MNKWYNKHNGARYGIDIRGLSTHAEADELGQILAVLNGHVGKARVIDRLSQTVLFDGTVDDVRESLSAIFTRQGDNTHEAMGHVEQSA